MCISIKTQPDAPYILATALDREFSHEDYCRIGDVVIADASEDYADIGKAIEIISVQPKSLVAGLHTYIARPIQHMAVGFAGYLFQAEIVRKQMMQIAQGISVLGISKTNLAKLDIPYPHPKEQQKIADFLTAIDDKITAVDQQIEQIEIFKKGLLQQMFI